MGKYTPLKEFLRSQSSNAIEMSFSEIERVIGSKLPPKAQQYRAWWSNNASNNVMTKAWLEAGFRSERVDMQAKKLLFRRIRLPQSHPDNSPRRKLNDRENATRHPLIGCMKGTLQIPKGVDLTEPADVEWGERAWGKER